MWRPKREKLIVLNILIGVLDPQNQSVWGQYIWHYCLDFFIISFPNWKFDFEASIVVIYIINYITEWATKAYLFAPSMARKSTIAGNITVFEDLKITQIG